MPSAEPTTYADLVDRLTLEEKAGLMSGANFWNTKAVPRLGIPSIMLTDGPHGLRKQGGAADHLGLNKSIPATCFPPAATLANTWNASLLARIGGALGTEAAAQDVSVLLGPGLNIKRNPLGGRNFEYFSEDPLLAGTLAAAFVDGVQRQGVSACLKHVAVNSQETHRMSVDEVLDRRALHEIYLEGFRIAVRDGRPWTVMSAYNKVNGTHANESQELLVENLRDAWGYDGVVVTDWGGNHDRVAGLRAGNALEMPSTAGVTDAEIVDAVRAGVLDEAVLDARVAEFLLLLDRTANPATVVGDHLDDNHVLAREAAREGMVLLRNEGGLLPLQPGARSVAVIGDFAEHPRIQGAGSSLVNPTRLDIPLDALREAGLDIVGYAPGYRRLGGESARLRREALDLAARAEVVLLFLGLDEAAEAEGVDRAHLRLAPNQLRLTRALVDAGARIAVVLVGGSPVELPFAGSVDAILHSYLPGQAGGAALADILTGVANPSGKLAETYPLRYEDVPSASDYARGDLTALHRESIYVGYRYYDKVAAPVRFCFGHGLSYTAFEYSDLHVTTAAVSLTVRNVGAVAGAEVVQVYVEPIGRHGFRPPQQLAGFAKVHLQPGEAATVHIDLAEHAFAFYSPQLGRWQASPGDYLVSASASSRDPRVTQPLTVEGAPAEPECDPARLPHYHSGRVAQAPDEEFSALLGAPLPPATWTKDDLLTRDSIIAQGRVRGGVAGLLFHSVNGSARALDAVGRPIAANYTRFVLDLPFRSLSRMSGGRVSMGMVDAFLAIANGRARRGLAQFVREARSHRNPSHHEE